MRIDATWTWISDNGQRIDMRPDGDITLEEAPGADGLRNEITFEKNAGEHGATQLGMSLPERAITLTGTIQRSRQTSAEALLAAFNPAYEGTLTYRDAHKCRSIRASIEQAPQISADKAEMNYFVSLLCPAPFWQDATGESVATLATWTGGIAFPFIINDSTGIEFETRTTSIIVDVQNPGQVPVGMQVRFTASGRVVQPQIMHMGTRQQIIADLTLNANEVVVIDTRYGSKGIYRAEDGALAPLPLYLMQGDYIVLTEGINKIRYAAADGLEALKIELVYTPLYLGV